MSMLMSNVELVVPAWCLQGVGWGDAAMEAQRTRNKQKLGVEMATLCAGQRRPVCYGYQIEALECEQHNDASAKNAGPRPLASGKT